MFGELVLHPIIAIIMSALCQKQDCLYIQLAKLYPTHMKTLTESLLDKVKQIAIAFLNKVKQSKQTPPIPMRHVKALKILPNILKDDCKLAPRVDEITPQTQPTQQLQGWLQ